MDPLKGHSARKMEVDYYMSDDKHHDAFYVIDNLEDLQAQWADNKDEEELVISDGGPNHYKCRQNWDNNAKRTGIKRKRVDAESENRGESDVVIPVPKRRHQSVRGENHGKGVVDGFNATGKAAMYRHEKRDVNDDASMQISHIRCAADCVRVGNGDQERKQKREGWQADTPQIPRKGRSHVAHRIT